MKKMKKRVKRQIRRRFVVATLTTAMLLGSSMTVLAAEPQNMEPIDVAMVSPTDEAAGKMVDINGAKVNSEVADQVAGLVESAEASALAENPNAAAVSAETVAELASVYATPRSISGFNYKDTSNSMGSLYVNVTGSASTGHVTLKTEYYDANADVYLSVYKPDGTALKRDIHFAGNSEYKFSYSNANAGSYRIDYYIPFAMPGRVDAWFY